MQVVEQFSDLSFIPCSFVAKDSSRKKRRSFKRPTLPSHDPVSTSLKTAAHHLFVTCRCFSHFSVLTKLDRIIPSYTQATNMELKPISIWKHEFARDVRYLLGFFMFGERFPAAEESSLFSLFVMAQLTDCSFCKACVS